MKKINLIFTIILFGLWAQPAMAYIDPGTGSAIISAIIGIFVATAITIKTYWYKLKTFFMGKKKGQQINPNQESEDEK
jgi:hypothetical protein